MVANHSRATASSSEVASIHVQTPMQQKPSATAAHRQLVSMSQKSKVQDRPRRSPAEVRAVASPKILRIQAAIASLGADDIQERSSLEAALSRAQRLLVIPPVDKRIEDTSGEEMHCSRVCRPRSRWARTMPAGVAGPSGSVGSRIVTSPRRVGTVKGWCGSRWTVWAKRETAMPHR